jgi:hypothetical protein
VIQRGALLLVATLPAGIQDDPNPRHRANYLRMVRADNLFYPDEHIRKIGDQHGFAVINLPEPMQQYAEAHQVFLHGFPNTRLGTGHWNEEGNHVAGILIAERIRQLLDDSASAESARPPEAELPLSGEVPPLGH